MKTIFIMGTRVLLHEYFFNLYFFEYSSTFKIKVLVLEYLGLVLVPNTVFKLVNFIVLFDVKIKMQ